MVPKDPGDRQRRRGCAGRPHSHREDQRSAKSAVARSRCRYGTRCSVTTRSPWGIRVRTQPYSCRIDRHGRAKCESPRWKLAESVHPMRMRNDAQLIVHFSCPHCGTVYTASQEQRLKRCAGRFQCGRCAVQVHEWTGLYNFSNWQKYRCPPTTLVELRCRVGIRRTVQPRLG